MHQIDLTNLNVSQCILPNLRPGNVKNAPIIAHNTARHALNVTLEAGPLYENNKLFYIYK